MWPGSELPEGGWLAGPEGSSIHMAGEEMPSSQLNCASAIVNFLKSGTVGEGSAMGVAKLNHCTLAPAWGRMEGPGLMDWTEVPT